MIDRRSLLHALPLAGLAAGPASAQVATLPAAIEAAVPASSYGAKGDGVTDDTRALQAALDSLAGRTLVMHPGIYKITSTLRVIAHHTRIEGNGAVIEHHGEGAAVDFRPINGAIYPQEARLRQFDVNVHREGASGVAIRASHSSFDDIYVTLRRSAGSSVGFDLVGDEAHGSGPYYNSFRNCSVQGQGAGQIGVRLRSVAPLFRGPNANTWLGGRMGQCQVGIAVSGCGNSFYNPTMEGCGTAMTFDSAAENFVFGSYLEVCPNGFLFSPNTEGNAVIGVFGTGVGIFTQDQGKANWTLSDIAAGRMPLGVSFGKANPDPAVLDHYGEGTWQPTLAGTHSAGRYDVATGGSARYIRIGRQVTVSALMKVRVLEQGQGVARFGGLPFPKAENSRLVGPIVTSQIEWPTGIVNIAAAAAISRQSTSFGLGGTLRGSIVPYELDVTQVRDGSEIDFSATYFCPD